MGRDLLTEDMRSSKKKIEQPNDKKEKKKFDKRQRTERANRQLLHRYEQKIEEIKKREESLFNHERICKKALI